MSQLRIVIQSGCFDMARESVLLQRSEGGPGAVVDFCGLVRADINADGDCVQAIFLEHYPGMAEQALKQIAEQACRRWSLLAVAIVHRVGRLAVGEPVVYLGVAASHRKQALAAVDFMMDFLKNEVPIWKKEIFASHSAWVVQKSEDVARKKRW